MLSMARNRIVAVLVFLAMHAWGEDLTVYVTPSGSKYHRETCPTLRATKIPLTLSEAIARGFRPCKTCKPPIPQTVQASAPQLYRVNVVGLATSRDADLTAMLPARVIGHIDGDTIRVKIPAPPFGIAPVETVRLLGIDAPETRHPTKFVQAFARESSDFTKDRLLGKQVYLAFDWNLRDRYRRLLAYVYLADGLCHNADMVREGYAHAYTRFPFQFLDEFRALQRKAREQRRGLWR